MFKVFLLTLSIAILRACVSKTRKEKNIEIVIEYPVSYKYDLQKEICTVFFSEMPASQIKFSLSENERNKIIEGYYDLKLDRLSNEWNIEDKCMVMPKSYTILTVKTSSFSQKIKIEDDCDKFNLSDSKKAKDVKEFLELIRNILKAKPEIKNAPKSDIIYM